MTDSDRDLREQFAALREKTGAGAPSFRSTLADAARLGRPGIRLRYPVAVALGAASVAALALAVSHFGGRRATLVDLTVVRWRAPTDFLLRTPGAELLRTMPAFTTEGRFVP
jgi:hypothetical protein